MFSEGDPTGKSTRVEIKDMSQKFDNLFSGVYGNSKYVVYSQHLDVIKRLLNAIDKPLYKNMALSLDGLQKVEVYLEEHEKELLNE